MNVFFYFKQQKSGIRRKIYYLLREKICQSCRAEKQPVIYFEFDLNKINMVGHQGRTSKAGAAVFEYCRIKGWFQRINGLPVMINEVADTGIAEAKRNHLRRVNRVVG